MCDIENIRFCELQWETRPSGERAPFIQMYTVDETGQRLHPFNELDVHDDIDEDTEMTGYHCIECGEWLQSWVGVLNHTAAA